LTTFLRLLAEGDKAEALRQACARAHLIRAVLKWRRSRSMLCRGSRLRIG